MVKKRRTSASASASASGPASPQKSTSPLKTEFDGIASMSAQLRAGLGGLGDEATAAGGSSRAASASATPAPMGSEERTHMKPPVAVPGSGDGQGYGEECFAWTDLPMNKTGKLTSLPRS